MPGMLSTRPAAGRTARDAPPSSVSVTSTAARDHARLECISPLSAMGGRGRDCRHGARHDQLDAEPPQLRARATRITLDAGADAGQPVVITWSDRPDETGIEREGERGIGQRGVLAELLGPVAPRFQQLAELDGRRAVIGVDRVRANRLRVPCAIETRGDRLLAFLRRAVVAEEDDVAEARVIAIGAGVLAVVSVSRAAAHG